MVPLTTASFELSFCITTATIPGLDDNWYDCEPEPDTDLLPVLSAMLPDHAPLADIFTLIGAETPDDCWLWDELDDVVLLLILVHPDAKTTKIKIPIISPYSYIKFPQYKSPKIILSEY